MVQGGGIGRYTRELVQSVVVADHAYHFRLFSARWPEQLPVADPLPGGPHVSQRRAPISDRWLYRLWYRLNMPVPVQWFTGPLSLYHSPDFVLPPVQGDIPTLVTVHDLSFIHYPQAFTPALRRYLERVVPKSVARASHILADSRATREDLISVWQVPQDRITVLYSGVSAHFKEVSDRAQLASVRQRYGLGEDPFVLSVGTVQPRKNYQMLIRAFGQASKELPHHLVIAGGKGWLADGLTAEVAAQGLDGQVHFIGFVADDDLPSLYSAADLFLFPSLYEGFGLPLLEAMACGTAVISSDASCLPEVTGEAAVLVSPHEQEAWSATMLELLHDPNRRAELAAAGKTRVKQFTWARAARELLSIYKRLLS